MRKGDKLICTKEVRNYLGYVLFEKGKEYQVLYVDHNDVKVMVCLNHTLYGNEYNSFSIEWVRGRFAHKKQYICLEDTSKGEAICLRTYFCDKLDGGVRFKKGDRVGYFELEGFIIITVDDYLPVSRTLFFRHFADVSDWREERINEIID